MKPVSGYQAPSRVRSELPASVDEQRLAWARGLSEMNLRALTSEYLMGKVDDSTTDAYEEYKRRFGEDPAVGYNKHKRP